MLKPFLRSLQNLSFLTRSPQSWFQPFSPAFRYLKWLWELSSLVKQLRFWNRRRKTVLCAHSMHMRRSWGTSPDVFTKGSQSTPGMTEGHPFQSQHQLCHVWHTKCHTTNQKSFLVSPVFPLVLMSCCPAPSKISPGFWFFSVLKEIEHIYIQSEDDPHKKTFMKWFLEETTEEPIRPRLFMRFQILSWILKRSWFFLFLL